MSTAGPSSAELQLVSRNCPICASNRHELHCRHDPWRLVTCLGCGLVFMPEVPPDAAVVTDFEWSESFRRERRERWMANPLMRFWTMVAMFLRPSRQGRAMRWIRRFAPSGRLLDVGCGDGRLLAIAQQLGFDVHGVEVSPQMAARACRRVARERIRVGRVESAGFEPESFDAAVSVSYLEHEPRPRQVMELLHRLLRPGGVTIHKVPNYASRLRSLLGQRWSGYRWPEHVQYYTPQTLTRLLTDTGFEIIGRRANPLSDNFWLAARKR